MQKMNLPNKLTMLRMCLVPVLMAVLMIKATWVSWKIVYAVAAVLFILTSLTDMLDGKIARKNGLITDFGKLMDPVADKFMVIGTMMVLFLRMCFPSSYEGFYRRTPFLLLYFVTLIAIIFRELGITSMRMVLAGKNIVVAADKLGKVKTVSQIVCVCTLLIEPYLRWLFARTVGVNFFWARQPILAYLTVATVLVTTVLSGFNYVRVNWQHFTENW